MSIAPFDRYQTIAVIRAVAESGRRDLAIYTGNDDNIVLDLITPYQFTRSRTAEHEPTRRANEYRMVGGLLGQWSVWTRRAVELLEHCRVVREAGSPIPLDLLRLNTQLTDANAAIFDAAHNFAGCIPGIHEILRRQGLLEGTWCLDPRERLSRGQAEEIDRVCRSYPYLTDDAFVAAHLDEWLK